MPSIRKLSTDEVRSFERKKLGVRKAVEAEYDAMLSEYEEGDYGVAELTPDENRLTVRNRMKAAAGRRNMGVEFMRTNNKGLMRFRVVARGEESDDASDDGEDAVASTPEPGKRGRGRPRKNQDEGGATQRRSKRAAAA